MEIILKTSPLPETTKESFMKGQPGSKANKAYLYNANRLELVVDIKYDATCYGKFQAGKVRAAHSNFLALRVMDPSSNVFVILFNKVVKTCDLSEPIDIINTDNQCYYFYGFQVFFLLTNVSEKYKQLVYLSVLVENFLSGFLSENRD